jgi:hypothetical protein
MQYTLKGIEAEYTNGFLDKVYVSLEEFTENEIKIGDVISIDGNSWLIKTVTLNDSNGDSFLDFTNSSKMLVMIEPSLSNLIGHNTLDMTKNIYQGDLLTIFINPSYMPVNELNFFLRATTRGQNVVVKEIDFRRCKIQSMSLNNTDGPAFYKRVLSPDMGIQLLNKTEFQHFIINDCERVCRTSSYTLLEQNGTLNENEMFDTTQDGITINTMRAQW